MAPKGATIDLLTRSTLSPSRAINQSHTNEPSFAQHPETQIKDGGLAGTLEGNGFGGGGGGAGAAKAPPEEDAAVAAAAPVAAAPVAAAPVAAAPVAAAPVAAALPPELSSGDANGSSATTANAVPVADVPTDADERTQNDKPPSKRSRASSYPI